MLKLLIADGTDSFRSSLDQRLNSVYLVRSCADGTEALKILRTFLPDIVVLDLTLPGVDGLSLLQIMKEFKTKPIVLATTRFVSDYVLDAASRIGVDYMMVKPCSTEATAERLKDLVDAHWRNVVQADTRTSIASQLLMLGISTNRKGYHFLREAIFLYARDPAQSITKELYPNVGKLWDADPTQVERAIRSAIEKAWANRNDQMWRTYFASGDNELTQKPTNSQFISRLADLIQSGKNQ